jgi:hypothetical protein
MESGYKIFKIDKKVQDLLLPALVKMKIINIAFGFSLIIFTACGKPDNNNSGPVGQNVSYLVKPAETDSNYSLNEESHYIIRNTGTHLNKLLLFIGGSYSVPKDYYIFCGHSASIGLDVVSLSYPNGVATAPLGTSSDQFIFDNYRQELCFGTQLSSVVSTDTLNSINTRAVKLIQYLKNTYPDQNWGQYLTAQNTLLWSKIIVAGHSQGSGHACYLSKKNLVDRVLMFSGPNDYSSYYTASANWLKQSGLTPAIKHFALLHIRDEIVPFSNQVINLQGLGLLGVGQNPTEADNLSTPYSNAHCLSVNIPAMSYHSSTIGANSKLPAVWTYMLTSD